MIITADWEGHFGWGEDKERVDQDTHEWKYHTESLSYTQLIEVFKEEAWDKDVFLNTVPPNLLALYDAVYVCLWTDGQVFECFAVVLLSFKL